MAVRMKVVYDYRLNRYCVMKKKNWYSRWKYLRAPKTKAVPEDYAHIWHWSTERGAQTYINQELKRLSDERES